MVKPTKAQIRNQMKKVNNMAIKFMEESRKFDDVCGKYYGEETYNDHDLDQIIDCLDYGQGVIEFEEFDELMKKINGSK